MLVVVVAGTVVWAMVAWVNFVWVVVAAVAVAAIGNGSVVVSIDVRPIVWPVDGNVAAMVLALALTAAVLAKFAGDDGHGDGQVENCCGCLRHLNSRAND